MESGQEYTVRGLLDLIQAKQEHNRELILAEMTSLRHSMEELKDIQRSCRDRCDRDVSEVFERLRTLEAFKAHHNGAATHREISIGRLVGVVSILAVLSQAVATMVAQWMFR